MFTITTAVATAVKGRFNSFFHKPEPEPTVTLLEFTDQQVTNAINDGRHVFEWDGLDGLVSEYMVKEAAGEWKLRVITNKSDPSRGFVAASPTGRRTLNIYKNAKCREIVAMGLTETFARIYVSRSRNVRHNQSQDVIEWVGRNYLMPSSTLAEMSASRAQTVLARELCDTEVTLSQTRMHSALEIVRCMRHDDHLITYIIDNLEELKLKETSHSEFLDPEEEKVAKQLATSYQN
jgi:hypothetical protein